MKKLTFTAVALTSATLFVGACSSDMGSMDMGSTKMDDSIPISADFNDADVMFSQHMIPHHEQAIEMSDIALDPQREPARRSLNLPPKYREHRILKSRR